MDLDTLGYHILAGRMYGFLTNNDRKNVLDPVILTKNLNVAYYNLKQILQDKHIPMDNEEHFFEKASFALFNQCFLV